MTEETKLDVVEKKLDDETKMDGSDTTENVRPGIHVELGRASKTGLGMFIESYFVFAISLVGTIWNELYYGECDASCIQVRNSITYVTIAGIMFSQLTLGFLADHLGRLWGSRLTVTLLFVGGFLFTVSYGANGSITGQMIMFVIVSFVFTLGVGGEYPMSATSAAERSEHEGLPRGRTVAFVFAHQGWGTLIYAMVLCFLLAVTGTSGCSPSRAANATLAAQYCNHPMLELTWRLSYGIGVIIVFGLFIYRWFILSESKVWKLRQESTYKELSKAEVHAQRVRNAKLLLSRKWFPRLFGAGFTWFLIDVAFYGNKLFAGPIIAAIIGSDATLGEVMNFNLLNAFVGFIGYYFAAFTIDYPWMGRVRMQMMGFLCISILFLACGIDYDNLSSKSKGLIPWFEFMYLMSSFFVQFGPNVTTWLLPVELFPTDVRAQAHGYCAAF